MDDVNNTNEVLEKTSQVTLQNQQDPYLQMQLNKLMTDQFINDVKQGRKNYDDFYKTIRTLSDEECKSLVYIDNVIHGHSHLNIDLDMSAYRAILISRFQAMPFPIQHYNHLLMYKINTHLPEAQLKWLKDDLRSAIFMYYLMFDQGKNKAVRGEEELVNNVVRYFKYEILSFNLDLLFILPQWSKKYIPDHTFLIGRFEAVKSYYMRNRINNKSISWLDPNNSIQVNWAYEYLTDDKRRHIILDDKFFPVTDSDKYSLILASLDIMDNARYEGIDFISNDIVENQKKMESRALGLSARDYVLNTMKNAWDKYSKSNSDEDGNEVKIYQKSKEKLQMLAKTNSTSERTIVKNLIDEAYDENLKNKS